MPIHRNAILRPYTCPKCNSDEIVWQEQIWEYRPVLGMDEDGTVQISDSLNHYDDDGVNGQFFCRECFYSWPTADVEVEF